MEITSWLCILIAMPFAVLVFITFQGLTFEQIIVEAIASVILSSKRFTHQTIKKTRYPQQSLRQQTMLNQLQDLHRQN